jgi:hypothetical protein
MYLWKNEVISRTATLGLLSGHPQLEEKLNNEIGDRIMADITGSAIDLLFVGDLDSVRRDRI